jgi:phospholipase C
MSTATNALLPWYLGYQGGDSNEAIQCMDAGDNGYHDNQAALNHGLNNHWARNNTPWSWGYYKRQDIPVQFAIAEGWTAGDMYQVRVNRFPTPIIKVCSLNSRNPKSLPPTLTV